MERLKQDLLEKVRRLGRELPVNTLDELIDQLGGPQRVAEVGGTAAGVGGGWGVGSGRGFTWALRGSGGPCWSLCVTAALRGGGLPGAQGAEGGGSSILSSSAREATTSCGGFPPPSL